jgi:2-methylcitrate dehydratase PrpD
VTCRLPPAGFAIVCDSHRARNPLTPYHMKNSLPYVLAIRAIVGHVTPEDFTSAVRNDPRVVDFASRVIATPDQGLPPDGFPAIVAVTTRDGRSARVDVPAQRGSQGNPLTPQEHRAKFLSNTSDDLGVRRSDVMLAELEDVWNASNIGTVIASTFNGGEASC